MHKVLDKTDPNPYWAHDGKRFQAYRFNAGIEAAVRKLNCLDNWHGILGYLRDIAVIIVSIAICRYVSWWCYPLSLLLIGSRQRAFSNLLHESAHGMLAANRRLNLALGSVLTAYPIFQRHYAYKRSHVATHHPRLGDPERDPDLRFFIGQGVYRIESRRQLWIALVVLPALGSKVVNHFWFLVRDRILLGRRQPETDVEVSDSWRVRLKWDRIAFGTFWLLVTVAVVGTGTWATLVCFWLVPYLTTFQVIGWYIELAEHTPLVRLHNVDLYMTRNRKSRGVEAFLTCTYADHYHLDHHLDPRTPYWNLRRAHLIRLRDPEYAMVDRGFGGLFTSGPDGQPSAIASIIDELATTNGIEVRPV